MKRKFVTLLALGLLLLQPIFADLKYTNVAMYESPLTMIARKIYVEKYNFTSIEFVIVLPVQTKSRILYFDVINKGENFFFTDDEMKTILKKLYLKIYDIPSKNLEPTIVSVYINKIVHDITKKSYFELDDISDKYGDGSVQEYYYYLQ